jgi:hypothetical protein
MANARAHKALGTPSANAANAKDYHLSLRDMLHRLTAYEQFETGEGSLVQGVQNLMVPVKVNVPVFFGAKVRIIFQL